MEGRARGTARSPGWSRGSGSGIYLPSVKQRAAFKVKLAVVALPSNTEPPDLREDKAASEMTPVLHDDWTVTSKGTACASATLIPQRVRQAGLREAARSRAHCE